MTDVIAQFLRAAGWGAARRLPLAGDASARRYERVVLPKARAVLMIAPPEDRNGFEAFLAVDKMLRGLGLSAPEVIAQDTSKGLMLLEDLGDRDFTSLTDDQPEASLVATDLLLHLARHAGGWSLPRLTPEVMARMTRIALPDGPETTAALTRMEAAFTQAFTGPLVPALRDVHAENLLWLPDRDGLARVGLLDFQDAVMAPAGYDLVSFITDARRDVSPEIARAMTDRYAQGLNLPRAAFATQCALLSLQRNLRIIGVFRRLAKDRGKPAYLTYLPRVHGHLLRALDHPGLSALAHAMSPLMSGLAP